MKIDHDNSVPPVHVYDVDSGELLQNVLWADTGTGEVVQVCIPVKVAQDGETVVTETMRFKDIWLLTCKYGFVRTIYCYGRLQ